MTTSAPTTAPRSSRRPRASAVVAIAAGAVLLLGGGTTLAYWSTQQVLNVGTVNSGDLNLVAVGTPTWTLQGVTDAAPRPVTDVTAVKLVPGDKLVMKQDTTLTLKGDTLKAALAVSQSTIPNGLTATVATTGATVNALTSADDGKTVTATVTITFDSTTANRDLVNTAFDLGSVTLTLTQQSQ